MSTSIVTGIAITMVNQIFVNIRLDSEINEDNGLCVNLDADSNA